jgi:hypothetical protein
LGFHQSFPGLVLSAVFTGLIPIALWLYISFSIARLIFGGSPEDMPLAGVVTMFLIFIAPFPIYFFAERKNKKAFEMDQEIPQDRRMEEWAALYYCSECGAVFLPGIGEVFIDEHEIIRATSEEQVKRFPLSPDSMKAPEIKTPLQTQAPFHTVEAPPPEPEPLVTGAVPVSIDHDLKVSETCWFCGKTPGKEGYQIKNSFYGNVRQERVRGGPPQTRWDTVEIEVPRCAGCQKAHARVKRISAIYGLLIMFISPTACFGPALLMNDTTGAWVVGICLGIAVIFGSTIFLVQASTKSLERAGIKGVEKATTEFEPVKQLLENGWELGIKPKEA